MRLFRPPRRFAAAGFVLAITLLTACSGGGSSDGSAVPTTAAPGAGVTIKPATHPINQSVWFAGFKITFGTATLHQTGAVSRKVDVDVHLDNEGPTTQTLQAPFDIDSAGEQFRLNALTTDLHGIAGKGTGTGLLSFDVDTKFSFNDAVIVVGRPSHQQATVPLGSTGKLITLEPAPLQVGGSVTSGIFKLDLTGGDIRSDSITDYVEAGTGERFLELTFNLSTTKSQNFSPANLMLQRPDGAGVKPDDAPVVILDPGPAQQNQSARFTVKDPPSGSYGLVLIDDSVNPNVRSTLTFTIP